MKREKKFIRLIIILITFAISTHCFSATKVCTGSGYWNNSSVWSPAGVPGVSDDVFISANFTINIDNQNAKCKSLVIDQGGILIIPTTKNLSVTNISGIIVNGTLNVHSGDISLSTSGAQFKIGNYGTVIWNPGDNTAAGATLFINGNENFSPTSTLKILKWYDYVIPLKNVISGSFGNLSITTATSGYIATWQMQNSFQTNPIVGTLTIDNGYVILDNTNSITTTNIGNILLNSSSSYLDLYDGSLASPYIVNTGNVTINGGELDCFYTSGTGTGTFNISGNLEISNSGYLVGANSHNGNAIVNVKGNTKLSGAHILGVFLGSGNFDLTIDGDFTMQKSGSTESEYNGIVNGNGNTSLTVGGNFYHQGLTSLIFNAGITGVGNGNAICNIAGTFTQFTGNFCGIWNLTSYNTGSCQFTAGNLDFEGGVFMVHYGCSTSSITNQLKVSGNLNINYTQPTDIFRGIGLSSLNNNNNSASLDLEVDGNLKIAGNSLGEFTTSASTGNEIIKTNGRMAISGGNNRFDFSNGSCDWLHTGDVIVSGGNLFFSTNQGNSTISILGDVNISGGTASLKGNSGICTLTVNGNFSQTSGDFNIYDNSSIPSSDDVTINVTGNFSHTGGVISFNNNSGNTGQPEINLKGDSYLIGGTGIMTSTGAGTGNLFGKLNFNRNGTIQYSRLSSTYLLQQVKQQIKNECKLQLSDKDLLIASSNYPGTDFLSVENGGILELGQARISSNLLKPNSGCRISQGGCIKTAKPEGLYNNIGTAAINSIGNMDYFLDVNSIVEYNSSETQTITGVGNGKATGNQHKYGILKINLQGASDNQKANIDVNTVFIRSQLNLEAGELKLNNHPITIEAGSASAIIRNNGYINCESNSAISNSRIIWKNIQSGRHIFPFGVDASTYIPLTFSPLIGIGTDIEISTSSSLNTTTSISGLSVTEASSKLKEINTDASVNNIINRWWTINAIGVAADLTFSYPAYENPTNNSNVAGKMMAQAWNGIKWGDPFGKEINEETGIFSVAATAVNTSSPVIVIIGKNRMPFQLLSFNAKTTNDKVVLIWNTTDEKEGTSYSIERSSNGGEYVEIGKIDGTNNINSTNSYSFEDLQPLKGTNDYRLRQSENGQYSPIRTAKFGEPATLQQEGISNVNVGPNPFHSEFNVVYNLDKEKDVELRLSNAAGQLVLQTKVRGNSGQNNYQFTDDMHLPPGNYMLNVISGAEMRTFKLIKSEY